MQTPDYPGPMTYEAPKMETIELELENIILASLDPNPNEGSWQQ